MAFIDGLTGGIGSGKSAAGTAFAQLGAAVIDTDAIAHWLTAPGGPAIGLPAGEVRRIMSAQVTRAGRLGHVTDTIENPGTVAELAVKVVGLHAKFLELAAKAGQINPVPAIPATGGLASASTIGRESPKLAP